MSEEGGADEKRTKELDRPVRLMTFKSNDRRRATARSGDYPAGFIGAPIEMIKLTVEWG